MQLRNYDDLFKNGNTNKKQLNVEGFCLFWLNGNLVPRSYCVSVTEMNRLAVEGLGTRLLLSQLCLGKCHFVE